MIRFWLIFFVFLLWWCQPSSAQQVDSVLTQKILRMQATIDSLQKHVLELERAIRQSPERSEFSELLSTFEEEETSAVPEDQRSRRKRVDALLQAIREQPGQLRFNGGATTTLQSQINNIDEFTSGVASFDIFAHTSFGENTLLFIDVEAIGGNGPNGRVATFASLNEDAGSTQSRDGLDRLSVLEAWAEFTAFNEAIKLTMGKIDLTNYFDNNASANDETTQFISGAFVNSAAFPVPGNSAGLRFITTVLDRFSVQFGAASMDNSGDDLLQNVFKIASVGFKVLPETPWEANLRIYGYLHPSANDAAGYGVSFDESIADVFNIFARYNMNRNELAQWLGIKSAWSAGARIQESVLQRSVIMGIAYGKIIPDDTVLKNESIAEFYLQYPINQWVHVSPHLQVVWNAGGGENRHAFVGVRTHFNF